jgi:hypothetical protein
MAIDRKAFPGGVILAQIKPLQKEEQPVQDQ